MSRKLIVEFLVTFFIAVIIYFLVDFNFIFITKWGTDKIINFLQTWLTLLTAYYIYNSFLKFAFKKWEVKKFQSWVLLLSSISALIIVYVALTEIIFYKFYYNVSSLMDETTFFEFDLPVTLVVLIFSSLFFYQKYYYMPIIGVANDVKSAPKKMKANKGRGHIFILVKDIGLFYSDNGVVWLQTLNGEKYTTNYTLNSLLNELNSKRFFRLNRQTIVAKDSIRGFGKLNFQKLEIELIETVRSNKPLVVSKYNAPAFKKWLTNPG
jgi:hypothetical protein